MMAWAPPARGEGWWQRLRSPVLPPAPTLTGWRDTAAHMSLAVLGALLPFSTAGVSVVLALFIALGLCSAGTLWRSAPWREPTCAAGLLLFAYIAAHTLVVTLWTGGGLSIVNKYHELLLFPLLLAVLVTTTRPDAFLWGLTAGSAGYALAHWVAPFVPPLAAELDANRISAGFCLAVVAYLLVHEDGPRAGWWRALAAFLALTVLFRVGGRTGHLVLLMLAVLVAWQLGPRRWRLPAAATVCAAIVLGGLVSPSVQSRVKETVEVLTQQRVDGVTSTGIRVALLASGWKLAADHQPLGVGYARFREFHEPAAREVLAGTDASPELAAWVLKSQNPHNEYLMQLASGGLPALALFLAWLAAPTLRRHGSLRASPAVCGTVAAFALACLFNSFLMDFVEGHFYMAVLAWLLARARRADAAQGAP